MKTQMRFQKIIALVALIVSALTVVYAFIFSTPIWALTDLTHANPSSSSWRDQDPISANATYDLFQQYNDILLVLSVIFVCIIAVYYITACNKRRNYYITNYVTVIVTVAYAVILSVLMIAFTAVCHISFINDVDWYTYWNSYYNTTVNQITYVYEWNDSAATCWIGYVIAVLTLAVAGALIFNMIWKIKLMKGERQLLANGLVKEVA